MPNCTVLFGAFVAALTQVAHHNKHIWSGLLFIQPSIFAPYLRRMHRTVAIIPFVCLFVCFITRERARARARCTHTHTQAPHPFNLIASTFSHICLLYRLIGFIFIFRTLVVNLALCRAGLHQERKHFFLDHCDTRRPRNMIHNSHIILCRQFVKRFHDVHKLCTCVCLCIKQQTQTSYSVYLGEQMMVGRGEALAR